MPTAVRSNSGLATRHFHAELKTTFTGVEHPLSSTETRIHQFRGIKYASVPARFRQSKLWTKYSPLTDASKHGPICPQVRHQRSVEETILHLPPDAIPRDRPHYDEFECLNLTITCPAGLTPQSHLPVMVWIHGGGDRGHGSNWLCDGGALVRKSVLIGKPVIIVAINFRIGLFGFAAGTQLLEDNKADGSDSVGNYGLRDQRMAMEWLHHYISGFGGDPNNITLFGSSTGAADIVCHLLSKDNEVRPLFHRAILQSAILEPIQGVTTASWHLSRAMGILRVSTIQELSLVEPAKLVGLGLTFWAVDDGSFFRHGWQDFLGFKEEHPKQHKHHLHRESRLLHTLQGAHARSRSIAALTPTPAPRATFQPLIIGDCSCDSLLWSVPASSWTSGAVVRRLRAICQALNKSSGLLQAYDITSYTPDDEITDRVLELINDARVAWPTHCIAQNAERERGGHGVWRYVFDQETPSRGIPHHAADLVYLFDNVPVDISTTETVDITVVGDSPKGAATPVTTAIATPPVLTKATFLNIPPIRGRHRLCALASDVSDDTDLDDDLLFDNTDSDESVSTPSTDDDLDWMRPIVDEWSYSRVRDSIQEKWIAFAHGESPWSEGKAFIFGPEGETGERSMSIFEGRRRYHLWQEALEPLGLSLVQKIGLELSRGPGGR